MVTESNEVDEKFWLVSCKPPFGRLRYNRPSAGTIIGPVFRFIVLNASSSVPTALTQEAYLVRNGNVALGVCTQEDDRMLFVA